MCKKDLVKESHINILLLHSYIDFESIVLPIFVSFSLKGSIFIHGYFGNSLCILIHSFNLNLNWRPRIDLFHRYTYYLVLTMGTKEHKFHHIYVFSSSLEYVIANTSTGDTYLFGYSVHYLIEN